MDLVTIIEIVASAVIAILAAVGVATVKIAAVKKEAIEAFAEIIELKDTIKAARDESSPDGKKLSQEELQQVVSQISTTFVELVDIIEVIKENWGKKTSRRL